MAETNEEKPKSSEDENAQVTVPIQSGGRGAIPKHIAGFRIEQMLGSGGMATVYRAYDLAMHRVVALKVLHPAHRLSDVTEARFVREAWIAGQLRHPNIVEIYTRGEDQGCQFIAMEFAEHGSLAQAVRESRDSLSQGADSSTSCSSEYIRNIVARFVPLCRALALIHERGYIHRDIKPQNILIAGPDRLFKLADFGIAHAEGMSQLTHRGDFMGTVQYMSPEMLVANRTRIDFRTDIYSLGVTIYETLTLSLPFEADSEERYIGEILSGRLIPARRRNKLIGSDLETIIYKATHRDPDSRYKSANELGDEL